MHLLSISIFLAAYTLALSRRENGQSHRHLRGQPSEKAVELLSGWQEWPSDQKMKVVYGVFTSPLPAYADQLAAVAKSWAKDVPPQKMLVVGVNGTEPGMVYNPAPNCQEGHIENAGISCKEATLLTTGYKLGADWVVVLGSDNYVFPRNLEQRLAREDPKEAQMLGLFGCGMDEAGNGAFCEDHKMGACGGGGYVLSRGALDAMVGKGDGASQSFIQESMETAANVSSYWSDQATSCVARRHGVKQVDLEGLYPWRSCPDEPSNPATPRFCEFNPECYRKKIGSTNPKPISFHYMGPNEMRIVHSMKQDADNAASAAYLKSGGAAAVERVEAVKDVGVSFLGSSRLVDPAYLRTRAAYLRWFNKEMIKGKLDATQTLI